MKNPSVSVIVPIFNAEKHLDDLFDSIRQQKKQFDEIILVDNNSTDKSYEKCVIFKEKNPSLNIKVLKETKKGPSAARNKGIKNSSTDLICFIDADCVIDKNYAENALKISLKENIYDVFGGIADNKEIRPKTLTEEFANYYWTLSRKKDSAIPMNNITDIFAPRHSFITTFNMVARKKVFEKTKGFDENLFYSEDIDFWARCCLNGFKSLAGIPELVVAHKNRVTFRSMVKQYFKYTESFAFIVKKYFPKKLIITRNDIKIFKLERITGIIEINPHTISIAFLFLIFVFPASYYILFSFLFIMGMRFFSVRKFLKQYNISLKKIILFSMLMEAKQIAVTIGAFRGMIKQKIIYLK